MTKTVIPIAGKIGQVCICKDPWYKKPMYLRLNFPRARWVIEGWAGLSEAQKRACSAFAAVASETAGIERWQRRDIIAAALRGLSHGAVYVKPPRGKKLTPAELTAKIASAKSAATAAKIIAR